MRDASFQHDLWGPAPIHFKQISEIVSRFQSIEIHPRLECEPSSQDAALPFIYVAATQNIAVNTMYSARPDPATACNAGSGRPHPLASDALLVLTGGGRLEQAGIWQDVAGAHCGQLEEQVLCASDPSRLPFALQPLPAARSVPVGQILVTSDEGTFPGFALRNGWSAPESWGVWSNGPVTGLHLVLPRNRSDMSLTMRMRSAPAWFPSRHVGVLLNGRELANWTVGNADADYSVRVPVENGVADLRFEIERPTPVAGDARDLGIGLLWIRVDELPP